jgi:Pyruvate/2-oxoacid:ferredoxin oxidoreductase delta subunit
MNASSTPLVSTIGERCRVCYQCVRECPAKAIRIADLKAQVLAERCIGCGVCFKVCTQSAKRVVSAVEDVEALLAGPDRVAAIIAPSFPAEFIDLDYPAVVGTLRALGFASVHEVAFGAELVSPKTANASGSRRRVRRWSATSNATFLTSRRPWRPSSRR